MSDMITWKVSTREAGEHGPAAVGVEVAQGAFHFFAAFSAEEAQNLGVGLLDAAIAIQVGMAIESTTESEKPEQHVEAMRNGETIAPHPCPHCGAEDNYRCCEFGRDRL